MLAEMLVGATGRSLGATVAAVAAVGVAGRMRGGEERRGEERREHFLSTTD